jgi:hypothetical protein
MAATKTSTEKAEAPEQEMQPINRQAGVITLWGPFANNTYVTTPHGEYSLQPGWVLGFDFVQRMNKKSLEVETVPVAQRRKATAKEIEAAGVDLSAMQPSKAFFDARDRADTPQSLQITVNGGLEGETFPGVLKRAPVKENH